MGTARELAGSAHHTRGVVGKEEVLRSRTQPGEVRLPKPRRCRGQLDASEPGAGVGCGGDSKL